MSSSSNPDATSSNQPSVQEFLRRSDAVLDTLYALYADLTTLPAQVYRQVLCHLHNQLASGSERSALRDFLADIVSRSVSDTATQHDHAQGTPQPPRTPPTTYERLGTYTQAPETPRAERVRLCFDGLKQIGAWNDLVIVHRPVLSTFTSETQALLNFRDSLIRVLAMALHDHSEDLIQVVPELSKVVTNVPTLTHDLVEAYQHSASQLKDMPDDRSLAYLLVHIALSFTKTSGDVDVLDTNDHLEQQFGRCYRGDAHLRFLNFVTRLNDNDHNNTSDPEEEARPYFRGTPIVQSSGTGKSRMIIETKSHTPLLYVCFRRLEADGNAQAGFPLPDQGVRNYFEDASQSHKDFCDLQVACFLAAWFTKLAEYLRSRATDPEKLDALLQLNCLDKPNQQRIDLFKAVSELAEQQLRRTPPAYYIRPVVVPNQIVGPSQDAKKDLVFEYHLKQPFLDLHQQLARISQYMLQKRTTTASSTPPILVAVDECVEINVSNSPKGNNQLNSLLRAWHYIRRIEDVNKHNPSERFWLVLLSTSSSAAALVEHVSAQASIRRQKSAALPTFVGVGFDVLADERRSLSCAAGASRFDQIIKYGRPLWSSLDEDRFWPTAAIKLQGDYTFNPLNPGQCFSVLASRLALRLVAAHWGVSPFFGEQKAFLDKAVDRHMRIVTHVTEHAGMHIDSASEPVLAVTASLRMLRGIRHKRNRTWKETYIAPDEWYRQILECFRTRCLSSRHVPLFKGSDGELAARLVLTVAWDAAKARALQRQPSNRDEDAVTLRKPVLLEDIIGGLAVLDPPHLATLQNRIKIVQERILDKDPSAEVQAWTNFTHFDVLPEPFAEITPEYLWYCWKRGVALQMSHAQEGIDGLIPVFIGDLEKPFFKSDGDRLTPDADVPHGACRMTYVAWEAKNRKEAKSLAQSNSEQGRRSKPKPEMAGPQIRSPASGVDNTALTERALFCILADLGTTVAFRSTGDQKPQVATMMPLVDCLCLRIRGVTDKHAYPCLDELGIRSTFRELLDDTGTSQSFGDNTVPHPLWNDRIRPDMAFPLRAAAADSETSSSTGNWQPGNETSSEEQDMEIV